VPDQQVAVPNLDFVALVLEAFEIGATTYQLL
jgi:hypothetical protein